MTKITGYENTSYLVKIDRFMDRYGLCVNNLVNCITKVCIKIFRGYHGIKKDSVQSRRVLGRYWSYIDQKNGLACVVGILPGVSCFISKKEKTSTYVKALEDDFEAGRSDDEYVSDEHYDAGLDVEEVGADFESRGLNNEYIATDKLSIDKRYDADLDDEDAEIELSVVLENGVDETIELPPEDGEFELRFGD